MIRFSNYSDRKIYENECYSDITNDILNTERLIFNKFFFEEAILLFSKIDQVKVPVFLETGEFFDFCFMSNDFRYDQAKSFIEVLNGLDNKIDFLGTMYSNKKRIVLYECNELSYLMYKCAKKHNIDVGVIGEGWEFLDIPTMEIIENDIDDCNLELFKQNDILWSVQEIIKMGLSIGYHKLKEVLNDLDERIPVCLCQIPLKVPFNTKWRNDFCRVQNVHNKIQGYEEYSNAEEERAVSAIYGATSHPVKSCVKNRIAFDLNHGISGKTYTSHRKKHRIFIIGPCIIRGYCVADDQTISYHLQQMIEEYDYEAIKIAIPKVNWILLEEIKNFPIEVGDIMLFVSEEDSFSMVDDRNNLFRLDMSKCYETMGGEDKPYFSDCPIHVNAEGHHELARYIFKHFLKEKILISRSSDENILNTYIQYGEILNDASKSMIKNYVSSYKKKIAEDSRVGAIVMNCNPFTQGHKYLITQASNSVDWLYVFVVEEDLSEFTFKDRFTMVVEGISDLKNVIVLPSGNFIISSKTLPSYFEKELNNNIDIDASEDIEIFARYVAPELNITKRFAGEEPIDNLTRQYNEQMRQTLPKFGIDFLEIPRLKSGNVIISASRVRKALKEGDWDLIRKMVPSTTLSYLQKHLKN